MFGAQGGEQFAQAVVIDLLHQRQQPAQLAIREAFTGEPVQVGARQIGDDPPLVFTKGHLPGHQQFKFFGIHYLARHLTVWWSKIQAFCMKANGRSCRKKDSVKFIYIQLHDIKGFFVYQKIGMKPALFQLTFQQPE